MNPFSRRSFLKGLGTSALATAAQGLRQGMAADALPAATPEAHTLGPGETEITLNINGTPRTLRVEPRVTLLDALRNRLDYTGAKEVCDRGTCGACTVNIDGKPMYACMVLAVDAVGQENHDRRGTRRERQARPRPARVRGIRRPDVRLLHAGVHRHRPRAARQKPVARPASRSSRPVRATFAAAARNRTSSRPSKRPRQRGGGRVSDPRPSSPPRPARPRPTLRRRHERHPRPPPSPRPTRGRKDRHVLTSDTPRLDGPRQGGWPREIFLRHPVSRPALRAHPAFAPRVGDIRALNVEKARTAPGVRAVTLIAPDGARIRYAGEEIAAVAAVSKQAADDALRLIEVDYEVLPHVVNLAAARADERAARLREVGKRRRLGKPKTKGDAEQRLRRRGGRRRRRIPHARPAPRLPGNARPDRANGTATS